MQKDHDIDQTATPAIRNTGAFGNLRAPTSRVDALARVEAWTRARFALVRDEVVLATELECNLPGCPPLETVVAFWTLDTQRHYFKVFKRSEMVVQDDLPFAWQKPTLVVPEGFDGGCC